MASEERDLLDVRYGTLSQPNAHQDDQVERSINKTEDTHTETRSMFDDSMTEKMEGTVHEPRGTFCCKFGTFWSYAGPGWLMAIAYLDPGNLVSDLQAGAYTGYQLLWVLLLAVILGWLCQVLALKLGAVTGKHLAQVAREEYPRWLSIVLWLLTEVVIVGNDIQQIIGSGMSMTYLIYYSILNLLLDLISLSLSLSLLTLFPMHPTSLQPPPHFPVPRFLPHPLLFDPAVAFQILFGLPLWAGALITAVDTFTFLMFQYFGIRKLEAFFATLVGTMSVCFFINYGVMGPDTKDILEGIFVPTVKNYAVLQLVALLGAVIMPHNIYLHSASVASRGFDRTNRRHVREAVKYFSIDAASALFVSFLINMAVISVFAKGFFNPVCAEQNLAWIVDADNPDGGCGEIGLFNAGDVLYNTLKGSSRTVWAIGLLAAGQSATMTGTFAGQYVMEGFINLRVTKWKRIVVTRIVALVPAVAIALVAQSNSGLEDAIDEWINVLQAVILPFAILPILHFTSSRRIMGDFAIGPVTKTFIWLLFFVVLGLNGYLISGEVMEDKSDFMSSWWFILILIIIALGYLFVIYNVVKDDIAEFFIYLRHVCGAGPAPESEEPRDDHLVIPPPVDMSTVDQEHIVDAVLSHDKTATSDRLCCRWCYSGHYDDARFPSEDGDPITLLGDSANQ